MPVTKIKNETREKMEKAVDFLKQEFRGVRTGRASTALVEHIKVEYYGSPTPLNQLANLSTPEATCIMIKPFDMNALKDIEKAIQSSSLGITPQTDGKIIRLNIPPLSGERRQQLVQTIKHMAEQARVSIRNIRRDAIKHLETEQKNKTLTEDQRDEGKDEIEKLTKNYIHQIDESVEHKSAEITEA